MASREHQAIDKLLSPVFAAVNDALLAAAHDVPPVCPTCTDRSRSHRHPPEGHHRQTTPAVVAAGTQPDDTLNARQATTHRNAQ